MNINQRNLFLIIFSLSGLRLEDNLSDGGEESPGAETSRGEETRRGNQLLKENKPAAQVPVGGNYFPEKIEIIPPFKYGLAVP